MKTAVAGTFNVIHDGHKALFARAFELGTEVCVGITSDAMAAESRPDFVPLHVRRTALDSVLRTYGKPYSIFVIDDIYGPSEILDDVDILIVSPETEANGYKINEEREKRGVRPLIISIVPLILASDGHKVSARSILEGKYGTHGYSDVLDIVVGSTNHVKVEAVRDVMEKVFGDVRVTGTEVDSGVPDQPFEEQTRQGAINRARAALGDLGWAGVSFGKEIPETVFEGYDKAETQAKVLAIVADGEMRQEIPAGTEAIVVLDRTTLYAEMGGQVGDHGCLSAEGLLFAVSDVQKNKGGKYMHTGVLKEGVLKIGDTVTAAYDSERRAAIARAHSATHLLQRALRDVLGDHVHQAGSLVEPDFLRFDFTHFSAVTAEELKQVEEAVNAAILEGLTVNTREMPIDEARKSGATALFGEKYGDVVRVVSMGDYSVELCGGTHLSNTAKAGLFHISSEGSVASGVRRIEATTGLRTLQTLHKDIEAIAAVAALFKANPADMLQKVEQQANELKEAKRLIQQYKDKESAGGADQLLKNAKEIGGLHIVTCSQGECDAAGLRKMGDALRDKDGAVVAVIAAVNGDKITFQCVCGKEAVSKGVRAGDIIKHITAIAGGKGGGKPDSAMGGGNDVSKLKEALAAVESFVGDKI